ncbi:MAG TPA: MlaE family lipid ABC transporter permease subunit [Burkholderiales bacterium]|nr:MlaE family lipid ABC transporter permease subunit [Burkholderiales bacterium]
MTPTPTPQADARADIEPGAAPGELRCSGGWVLHALTALERRVAALPAAHERELRVDASAVTAMDTSGAWLLVRTLRALEARGAAVRLEGLRPEFDALVKLIAARVRAEGPVQARPTGLLERVGRSAWEETVSAFGLLAFVGEGALALARALADPRRIRWRPILYNIQTAGFEALPITGLLSFLMGIVIAYQGATQLERFGANIYVVDLVGLSMARELSPLITAIIVAGRSGSAYAAQIGTMKVTEEIDALRTIGVGPLDLLVLPKVIALMIALPLLTVYTDVMGVFGGMVMAEPKLGISFGTFVERLGYAVSLSSYLIGIGKAPVFAVIIALVGCYQGFQVTGSAESVGRRTTVSVVQSIFLVILVDALFSVVFNWLKL